MTDREARAIAAIEPLVDQLKVLQLTGWRRPTPIDGVVDELIAYLETVLGILAE